MARSRRAGNHLLRERREQLQMTQAQLAAMVGVTERTIQAYESEARQPQGRNRSRLVTALGVDSGEQIGLPPSATVRRGPRSRVKETSLREAVAQVMTGRLAVTSGLLHPPDTALGRVGRADIDELRAMTRDLAAVVGRYGGAVLHPEASTRLWPHAARLVHGRIPDELTVERGAAVIEHGITLSWAHSDANAHERALSLLLACLAVARNSGPESDTLIALTMGALVRWAILSVRFRDAREVADEALPVGNTRNIAPDVVAWYVAARACAAGHMGDVQATHALVARAEKIAEGVTETAHVGPGDRDLLLGYGLASLELCAQRPGTAAAPVLARAAAGMPEWDRSRRAIADSVHMLVSLAVGDISSATTQTRDLISRAAVMRSCLVDTNIANAKRVPAIELAEAADLRRLVDAYVTTLIG